MYILYPILARADIKKETNFYICDIFLVSEGDRRQKENGAFFVENDKNALQLCKKQVK